MKTNKNLTQFIEEAQETDIYWMEKAKLDFALGLEKQRNAAKLNYAAIAKKIGTSAAYITKIFRGDTNVTIESMVKLARATGGRLDIQIVNTTTARAPLAAPVHWRQNGFGLPNHGGTHTTRATNTVIQFPKAANDEQRERFAA